MMYQRSALMAGIQNLRMQVRTAFRPRALSEVFLIFSMTGIALGGSLTSVKTVYIESLGTKPGASEMSKQLAAELKKTAGLQLTLNKAQADAFIDGDGEIWTRGHISLNPRSGNASGKGQPVYGGVLSVELRSRDNSVLWSYLATPHSRVSDVEKDLSHQVAKSLKTAIDKDHHP